MSYKHISTEQVREKLRQSEPLQLVDVRRPEHRQRVLPGAVGGDDSAALAQLDPDVQTVVYCYKGVSSQSAAASLVEAGFAEVYSMDGGFEVWSHLFADDAEATQAVGRPAN